jgi:2',3'-cyclic-nucleotide 2'-phosphodiesterase (5'-nucleotidase family)
MNFYFKYLTITTLSLLISLPAMTQNYKSAEWDRVKMDSSYNSANKELKKLKTHSIIAKYKPAVDSLYIIIGHTPNEIQKFPPESPLSNFAADAIRSTADKYMKERGESATTDMAVTNFGGIRTSIPAGNISTADIMSVFPFENRVVIVKMQGKYIRQMMQTFARTHRVEALSGVEVIINNGKLDKCLIGGKPIDDNKIYRIATIDFLIAGGDNVFSLKNNNGITETGILIRDAIIKMINKETAAGRDINPQKDGRVKIIGSVK